MNTLFQQFADQIFTFNFLWICVASSITMEVLKWNVPYLKNANSKYYPLFTLIICAIWVFLKTAISGDFKDWLSNFMFTVLLTDIIYRYLGQYIIQWLIGLFQIKIGNQPKP